MKNVKIIGNLLRLKDYEAYFYALNSYYKNGDMNFI
jgi:hypothetical protein